MGNGIFGRLIPVNYIPGLETADLTELLIPGEEEEDTEILRKRYFDSFHSQAFGGNKKDYMDKTHSIPGVGAVKVAPVWNGAGTVKLTILDAGFRKADRALIEKVQQVIDPLQDGEEMGLRRLAMWLLWIRPGNFQLQLQSRPYMIQATALKNCIRRWRRLWTIIWVPCGNSGKDRSPWQSGRPR